MEDDFIDQDDNISIWRLCSLPTRSPGDPPHISRDLRDRLVRHRIAQIERECAENFAALREARERNLAASGGTKKSQ